MEFAEFGSSIRGRRQETKPFHALVCLEYGVSTRERGRPRPPHERHASNGRTVKKKNALAPEMRTRTSALPERQHSTSCRHDLSQTHSGTLRLPHLDPEATIYGILTDVRADGQRRTVTRHIGIRRIRHIGPYSRHDICRRLDHVESSGDTWTGKRKHRGIGEPGRTLRDLEHARRVVRICTRDQLHGITHSIAVGVDVRVRS